VIKVLVAEPLCRADDPYYAQLDDSALAWTLDFEHNTYAFTR
jgi:hypothetical protein